MTILTSEHPKWNEFAERLEGPEGCNFQEDENGHVTWTCFGGHDQRFAKAILEKIEDIDVEATLEYFTEQGGHCDCEILFNVE